MGLDEMVQRLTGLRFKYVALVAHGVKTPCAIDFRPDAANDRLAWTQ